MKTLADENIPLVRELFGRFGPVETRPGRSLTPQCLRDVDILLVRSVTPVDRRLLHDSPVQFVGTATIGHDHIDRAWLQERGIGFASAPGSNANAVAEYVLAAILETTARSGVAIESRRVGIIGRGNIGSLLRQKLANLGVACLVNDPPLENRGAGGLCSLKEACQADIITFHVPLTTSGPYPTAHIAGREFFLSLRPGTVVINTSRGSVLDGQALPQVLRARDDLQVVLDVWEGEPDIDRDLLSCVLFGTPHIAGYSLEGKRAGAHMLYRAACEFFTALPATLPAAADPLPAEPVFRLPAGLSVQAGLLAAVRCSYDLRADDQRLRSALRDSAANCGPAFDRLRRHYPIRREFAARSVSGVNDARLHQALQTLGFHLPDDTGNADEKNPD